MERLEDTCPSSHPSPHFLYVQSFGMLHVVFQLSKKSLSPQTSNLAYKKDKDSMIYVVQHT